MRFRNVVFAAAAPLFLAFNSASAQEDQRSTKFGILGGMSWSNLSNDDLSGVLLEAVGIEKKARKGSQVGAFVTFPFGRYFSIQPEVHYVQKGAVFEFSGFGNLPGEDPEMLPPGAQAELRLAYLEIPVLARIDFGTPDAEAKPFIVGGPVFSLRGSCQYAFKVSIFDAQFQCDESEEVGVELPDATDPVKKFDTGIMIGGGLAIRFFGLPTTVQARYSRSLSSIANESRVDVKNTALSVLFGIGF